MKRFRCTCLAILLALAANLCRADILFESGALGPTGIPQGSVAATNITPHVFTGVRFELTQPVITTQVGGHFVDRANGTFFGAIVELDDQNDFPNSGNLLTPDVLGTATLTFPNPSSEVFGNLNLSLDAGWYALVFGSGLFGTSGDGAAPMNNPDIGSPAYIAFQPGSAFGWVNISTFRNHRFVVTGSVVPEPSTIALGVSVFLLLFIWRVRFA